MAIAIRAKQSLTRRHLLVRSASTVALAGLGGLAGPYLSRAADRPQIANGVASGDVSAGSAVVWARADRPARLQVECSTLESFKTIIRGASSEALPERDFTSKVLLEGLPPRQHISTGCSLKTSLYQGYREKRRLGISGQRRSSKVRYRLSGRAIPRGRAGVSMRPAAACELTRPCSKTVRISSFIPAITSTPTVPSPLS